MAKRLRGGQPNNKSAWKHGFYSSSLSKRAKELFRQALDIDPKDLRGEIAVMRTTLAEVVHIEPGNVEIVALVARTLTRMVAVHFGLNRDEQDDLHTSFVDLIDSLRRGTYDPDEDEEDA